MGDRSVPDDVDNDAIAGERREGGQAQPSTEVQWAFVGMFGIMWVEALQKADPDVYHTLACNGRLLAFAKLANARIDGEYKARRDLLLRTHWFRSAPIDLVISLLSQARKHALSVVLPRIHEGLELHQNGWDLEAARRLLAMMMQRRIPEETNLFQPFPELGWLVMDLECDWQSRESLFRTLNRTRSERERK